MIIEPLSPSQPCHAILPFRRLALASLVYHQVRETSKERFERINSAVVGRFVELLGSTTVNDFDGRGLSSFLVAFASAKALPLFFGSEHTSFAYSWCNAFIDGVVFVNQQSATFEQAVVCAMPWKGCVEYYMQLRALTLPAGGSESIGAIFGEDTLELLERFASLVCKLQPSQHVLQRMAFLLAKEVESWRECAEQSGADVEALVDGDVDKKDMMYNAVKTMAAEILDCKLVGQVELLYDTDCLKHVLMDIKQKHDSCKSRDESALSQGWLELLKPSRKLVRGLRAQIEQEGFLSELFQSDDSSQLHFKVLDGRLNGMEVATICANVGDEAFEALRSQWVADAESLAEAISGMCPAWQPFVEDPGLLSKENIKKLLSNRDYKKISPSCALLGKMVDLNKSFITDTSEVLFSPELVKKCTDVKTLGYDTVSFTYAIYQCYVEIPKLGGAELKTNAVTQLRRALSGKSFTIPVALENRMKALDGTADASSSMTSGLAPTAGA